MINDSKLLRAALIFIACTSFIVCGVQPIFMGLVTEQLSLSLDQQGWVLSLSYYMALITTNDPTGKLTPLVSITLMGAAAATPALITTLVEGSNQQLIFLLGTGALVIAFAVTCLGVGSKGLRSKVAC